MKTSSSGSGACIGSFCPSALLLGRAFAVTLGIFIYIFSKDLKFSHVGSIWGLGSQLSGGYLPSRIIIARYSHLVLFSESHCQTPNPSLSKMPLGHTSSSSTFDYLSLGINIWHGCVQVLPFEGTRV